jgi:hypothetical protein
MKTDRCVMRGNWAIIARLHRRRVDLLICALVISLLVAACSGTTPQGPAPIAPATRQGSVTNQGNPPNTQKSGQPNTPLASQGDTPSQNAVPPTANTGPPSAPATSQAPHRARLHCRVLRNLACQRGLVRSIETVESPIAKCMSDAGFGLHRGRLQHSPPRDDRRQIIAESVGVHRPVWLWHFDVYTGQPPQLSDGYPG